MTPPIMGITHARVVLYSIDMARMEVCDLIVDTGSTLSWVPEEVAARVGIRRTGTSGRWEYTCRERPDEGAE